MKSLKEFDCLCLIPPEATLVAKVRLGRVAPQAALAPLLDIEAQLSALDSMSGAYVLFLPAYVLPTQGLTEVIPDARLLDAGYQVTWMAKNAVTSQLVVAPGPELWLRSDLRTFIETKGDGLEPKRATIPECHADWAFNTSFEAAFMAAFSYISTLRKSNLSATEKDRKATIAATFGTDAPFADWWHLGVLATLLGATDRFAAYEKEKAINDSEADLSGRLLDLSLQAKQELGLDVCMVSRKNSGFFRQNRFLKPEKAVYESIAARYEELGITGVAHAQKYRAAAAWVWGA